MSRFWHKSLVVVPELHIYQISYDIYSYWCFSMNKKQRLLENSSSIVTDLGSNSCLCRRTQWSNLLCNGIMCCVRVTCSIMIVPLWLTWTLVLTLAKTPSFCVLCFIEVVLINVIPAEFWVGTAESGHRPKILLACLLTSLVACLPCDHVSQSPLGSWVVTATILRWEGPRLTWDGVDGKKPLHLRTTYLFSCPLTIKPTVGCLTSFSGVGAQLLS